ncbi:MAG: MarC family protein [Flavobacteriales bacterium]|nr:MarC family protein [Flavobacteriales bacterium]MDG1765723.1 MarC family protein [Flavobacteriales bacterium]
MNFNFTEFFSASMVMFAVIDIIGSIPLLVDIKKKTGEINAKKATFVSLIIMVSFLFLGEGIIKLFGIEVHSFAVAGSFVLFFLSLEMILGVQLFKPSEHSTKTAAIVPIAFPIIAGAGTMTTLISLRAEYQQINILAAIFVNMILVYAVLKLTKRIEKLLGEGGIAILQKAFGIILLAIAVKLFTANVSKLF